MPLPLRTVCLAAAVLLLVCGCTRQATKPPSDGLIRAAQLSLVDRCMSARGLAVPTRSSARNPRAEAAARMSRDPAYRAALDRWNRCGTGTRDLERCRQQSGLVALRTRMEAGQLRYVRTLHRGDLALYRTLRAQASDRAERVLARARPPRRPRPQPT